MPRRPVIASHRRSHPRSLKSLLRPLVLGLCLLLPPARGEAQIAQATAHVRGDLPYRADTLIAILSDSLAHYSAVAARLERELPGDVALAREVARAAREALLAVGDPRELRIRWERFQDARDRYADGCTQVQNRNCPPLGAHVAGPLPGQVFAIAPAVVFGVGWGLVIGADMKPVNSFAVSTNLLGAAAGSLLGAIGSQDAREYFSKNLAVGTAFPTRGPNRLTGFVQLGLGQIAFQGLTLWPVLGVEQRDAADQRVPRALAARKPDVDNWTAPSLDIGFVFWSPKEFQRRVAEGKPAPVLTVGIAFPYYFPGDPFESLAGLVTNRRGDYEKQGKVQFSVGVAYPLVRP